MSAIIPFPPWFLTIISCGSTTSTTATSTASAAVDNAEDGDDNVDNMIVLLGACVEFNFNTATTSSSRRSSTASLCERHNWFGKNDKKTKTRQELSERACVYALHLENYIFPRQFHRIQAEVEKS